MQNLQNLKIAAVLTLVAAAMLWLMAVPAYASDVRVTIDGEAVVFAEQPPVIVDGRVLVPVRGVFEELGFTVSWNRDTRQAILERADYTIVLTIGSEAFTTNNTIAYLDVPAQIIGGSTMLPIRAVLESVGYQISWDNSARTAVIVTTAPSTTQNAGNWEQPPRMVVRDATSPEEEVEDFLAFVYELAAGLTDGEKTEYDKVRAIYDFIVLNFEYLDGRDGAAVDGTRRPARVPQPTIFTRTQTNILEIRDFPHGVTMTDVINNTPQGRIFVDIVSAWELLLYGDGVCDNFAALMTLMVQSLGIEAKSVGGYYVNTDGRMLGHMWTAVRISGNWYFFDPQIEASNLTRRTENRDIIPYFWFLQAVDHPTTIQRYIWDEAVYGSF